MSVHAAGPVASAVLGTVRVGTDADRLGVDPTGEKLAAELVETCLKKKGGKGKKRRKKGTVRAAMADTVG